MSPPRFRLKSLNFRGVLGIIIVQNHTFSYMVDHFKTLKILNYHLKLSGPRFLHLDRPPTFAAYILILQEKSRTFSVRIVTKIIMSDTSSRHGPSVDRAHLLHSLRVRGALILRETRRKIARFSPKTSGKFRENQRGTRATPAAQA